MSRAKWMIQSVWVAVFAMLVLGCSGSIDDAPKFNVTTGQHPAGWTQSHWAEYVKHPTQCGPCHGSTADPAAAGGTSKVSCFTCHAQGVDHPAGWAAPGQHGRAGAQLAPSTDPKVMAGFAHCTKCHGDDFAGGVSGVSCKACHTKAPHPDRPWLGNTAVLPNHDKTDFNNAPECFKCHANGANSTLVPSTPAPVGTAPGCYNNTMCHDRNP